MTLRMLPILALAAALLAQAPFQPAVDQIKAYLNLQDSQIQTLQQLRQQQMQAVQSTLSEMAAKQQSLREQLDRGSTDATALGKLLLEIEALRKRANVTDTSFRTQAVNVLTTEQKTKLAALEQAHKLAPAIQQAVALGLVTPPDPAAFPGPGVWGFGRGAGSPAAGPLMGPRGRGMGPEAGPMRLRTPRGSSPIPQ